jgi:hypothetical protein
MFRQISECFWSFFGIISAIAEALYTGRERERERERERDECICFSGIFSALNFRLKDGVVSIKNKNY